MNSKQAYASLAAGIFATVTNIAPAYAGGASMSVQGTAEAKLEKDGNGLYLRASRHTFELAQYAHGQQTRTVLVEGEVSHRYLVTDDIGAVDQPNGTVKLTIRPIDLSGHFGSISATREIPGDEIKNESPEGINVIEEGCCAQNSAESMLSFDTLKTLYVRSGGMPLTTYTILGKPALGRLIAIYMSETPLDEEVLGKDFSVVALITVTGEGEVLQRIRVHYNRAEPRGEARDWSYEPGWKTASGKLDNHTVIDPAKPSKPVFEWNLGDGKAIEIPLVNDRLDIAAAKLPANVTLEAIAK